MKKFLICAIIFLCFSASVTFAGPSFDYEYRLYKNLEDFGFVVYPKEDIFPELDQYIQSISFEPVDTGKAVMRLGPDGENAAFMMPRDVQDKYSMKKFIIIQVLSDQALSIGIFDPNLGLALPPDTFQLDEIKENIRETLKIFRGIETKERISFKSR